LETRHADRQSITPKFFFEKERFADMEKHLQKECFAIYGGWGYKYIILNNFFLCFEPDK
jgi:hypothetical protein